MFIVVALSVLALGTLYLAWRLVGGLHLGGWRRALALSGLVSLVALMVIEPVRWRLGGGSEGAGTRALVFAAYVSMGLFSLLFALTVAKDAVLLGHRLADVVRRRRRRRAEEEALHGAESILREGGLDRRRFLARSLSASVVGVSGALTGTSVYFANQGPELFEVDVPLIDLPAGLEGLRIAQISDVHVGPTLRRGFVEEIVARVNALSADLIAITGDLVDGSVETLGPHTAPLADLKARHGAFFVTGNHEYYSGADDWVREVRRLGITVLENEHQLVEHEGARLLVAGVTDLKAGGFDPEKPCDPARCLEGAPAADLKLLLAHQPVTAFDAKGLGYHLQLSGHTHGGQFFPWNLAIHLAQPLVAGLYDVAGMKVYVNRGTGYWGPPMRLGPPSEITLLTLRKA